jgi:hypothetical protein
MNDVGWEAADIEFAKALQRAGQRERFAISPKCVKNLFAGAGAEDKRKLS